MADFACERRTLDRGVCSCSEEGAQTDCFRMRPVPRRSTAVANPGTAVATSAVPAVISGTRSRLREVPSRPKRRPAGPERSRSPIRLVAP